MFLPCKTRRFNSLKDGLDSLVADEHMIFFVNKIIFLREKLREKQRKS